MYAVMVKCAYLYIALGKRLWVHSMYYIPKERGIKPKWYYEVDAMETHTGRNEQDFNRKDPS